MSGVKSSLGQCGGVLGKRSKSEPGADAAMGYFDVFDEPYGEDEGEGKRTRGREAGSDVGRQGAVEMVRSFMWYFVFSSGSFLICWVLIDLCSRYRGDMWRGMNGSVHLRLEEVFFSMRNELSR